MTPGMNLFIRNGKIQRNNNKVKTTATILGMTEKNLLKVAHRSYFLIFVSSSVESSEAAVRNLLFSKEKKNPCIFSPLFLD